MSDIAINVPAWFVVVWIGFEYWPVVLVLALVASVMTVALSRAWRVAAIVVAVLMGASLAASAVLGIRGRRDEARTEDYGQSINSVLTVATSVDGLALPAGTEVTWTGPAHTHVNEAVLPHPTAVLGVSVSRVQRTVDDGWAVQLTGAQSIGGWTCRPDLVELKGDGQLRRCYLASERQWNGWPIPAGTLIALDLPNAVVGLVFPPEHPVMSPEIGRDLPATGQMTINGDGSLDTVYFEAEAPLVVCGVPLWNTVQWRYAASTHGRERPVEAVTGALLEAGVERGGEIPAGTTVELHLPGCALTRD